MANIKEKIQQDLIIIQEPKEMFRLLYLSTLEQALSGKSVELYLPAMKEHAECLINKTTPLKITRIFEEDRDV
jgi:hypothetical protein